MQTPNDLELIITEKRAQGKYVAKFFYKNEQIYGGLLDIELTKSHEKYARDAYSELKNRYSGIESFISMSDVREAVRKGIEQYTKSQTLPDEDEIDPDVVGQFEAAEAMARDPNLLRQIADDLKVMGITKQAEIALAAYLVGTSRLLDDPLHMIIQGPSSSGKSFIVRTVASLFPDQEKLMCGTLTSASLFHLNIDIKHKFLVLDERPRQTDTKDTDMTAAYRMLVSEKVIGRLTTESTKDGKLVSRLKKVEGPVSSIGTASHADIPQEDRNRFIMMAIVATDEIVDFILARNDAHDAEQIKAIEEAQRRIRCKHYAFQLTLKPYKVEVPHIISKLIRMSLEKLELHEEKMRVYQLCRNIIASIALLYQHQRRKYAGDTIIKATLKDYEMARSIIDSWLGQIVSSEGKEISRHALTIYHKMVEEYRRHGKRTFYVSDVHEIAGGFSMDSVRKYLLELVDAGLLTRHRLFNNKAYEYELTSLDPSHFYLKLGKIMIEVNKKTLWEVMRAVKKERKEIMEYERTHDYTIPFNTTQSQPSQIDQEAPHDQNGRFIPTAKEWAEAGRRC